MSRPVSAPAMPSSPWTVTPSIPSLRCWRTCRRARASRLSLVVLRNGVPVQMTAHPAKLDTAWKLGFATVPIPFRNEPLPLTKATAKSIAFCADNSFLIAEVLQRILPAEYRFRSFRACGHCPHGRRSGRDEGVVPQVRPGRRNQPQPRHPQPASLSDSRWRNDPACC